MTGTSVTAALIAPNDPTINQSVLYDLPVATFQHETSTNLREFEGYFGDLTSSKVFAEQVTRRKEKVMLTYQTTTPFLIAMIKGKYPSLSASVDVRDPVNSLYTVPTETPEIVIADLAGLTVSDVVVSTRASATNAARVLKIVTGTPANAGEVKLDEPNTKLVFHADLVGREVRIIPKITRTNVVSLGVEDTETLLDGVEFVGGILTPLAPRVSLMFTDFAYIANDTVTRGNEGDVSIGLTSGLGEFKEIFYDL